MIILSGGGDPAQVEPLDRYFADSVNVNGRVIYVPLAMEENIFTYEACLAWFRQTYSAYGITRVEMWKNLENRTLDDDVAAVFIGGGNTFKLLKEVRQSGFEAELKAYISRGGIVYGGSAGAILLGRSIEIARLADENRVKLTNLNGLNLLGGWDVLCHYANDMHVLIDDYPHPLYALNESSGMVFDGGKITAIGTPYVVNREGARLSEV